MKIYSFILEMSSEIVKYENFIMDKNENIQNIKNLPVEEKEETLIWEFLNKIMIKVEIVYKHNKATKI